METKMDRAPRLLRRHAWCREKDFKRNFERQALEFGYTRCSWEPVTITGLQKRATWQILGGADVCQDIFFSERELRDKLDINSITYQAMSDQERFARQYIDYLRRSKALYNDKWRYWSWRYQDDQIMLRYAVTHDWAPIGLVILERDY